MVALLFWPEAQKSFYVDFCNYKGLQQKLELDLLLPWWLSHYGYLVSCEKLVIDFAIFLWYIQGWLSWLNRRCSWVLWLTPKTLMSQLKAKTCCKSNDIRFFSIEKHVTFWFTNLASVLVWAVFWQMIIFPAICPMWGALCRRLSIVIDETAMTSTCSCAR